VFYWPRKAIQAKLAWEPGRPDRPARGEKSDAVHRRGRTRCAFTGEIESMLPAASSSLQRACTDGRTGGAGRVVLPLDGSVWMSEFCETATRPFHNFLLVSLTRVPSASESKEK
jgi:hypothetical protein